MAKPTPTELFIFGLQHHLAGRLDEALKYYNQLLIIFPEHPTILNVVQHLRQQRETMAHLTRIRRSLTPFYQPNSDCQVSTLSQLLEATFGQKLDGFFVEVGAYDGRSFSNTDFLASLGWRGLYIEPVPAMFRKCAAWHRGNAKIEVINCAIGTEEGELDIIVGEYLSTALEDQRLHYATLSWAKDCFQNTYKIRTPKRRLETILNIYDVPKQFELLVVDVEGMEREVLQSFDLKSWAPRMAIVELEDFHPDFACIPEVVERCQAIRKMFADAHYHVVYLDAINTVFVR